MIALPNDSEMSMDSWRIQVLPDNTHHFHMQHEFRFSSKRPMQLRLWQKLILSMQLYVNYCRKELSTKHIWINIKTKDVH